MIVIKQKQLKQDIKRATEIMGIDERELAERALRFYLASIQQEVELQSELEAWERVSDETLLNMEQTMLH
jgi:hypothetical protein